jgi:hypothetical protein
MHLTEQGPPTYRQPVVTEGSGAPAAPAGNAQKDNYDERFRLRVLEVTQEMIEVGICEARECSLGAPLDEVVTKIYFAMAHMMLKQNFQF